MLLLTGAVLTVLGIAFHKPILYLLGASDATYPYAADYLTVYLLGTVCVMTSLGLNPYINSQGFARIGMLTVLVGAAANIVLDPLFIFALGMGVRGAAVATVLSQLLSALWVLRFLTGPKAELRLHFHGFRPDFRCICRIAALGTSSFVMSFTDSLVQVACNATLRTFGGDLYISVMTVINSVRQIAQDAGHGHFGRRLARHQLQLRREGLSPRAGGHPLYDPAGLRLYAADLGGWYPHSRRRSS